MKSPGLVGSFPVDGEDAARGHLRRCRQARGRGLDLERRTADHAVARSEVIPDLVITRIVRHADLERIAALGIRVVAVGAIVRADGVDADEVAFLRRALPLDGQVAARHGRRRELERRIRAADFEWHAADHPVGIREVVAQQVIAGLVRRTHLDRVALGGVRIVAVGAIVCARRVDRDEVTLVVRTFPADFQRAGHLDRRGRLERRGGIRHLERGFGSTG